MGVNGTSKSANLQSGTVFNDYIAMENRDRSDSSADTFGRETKKATSSANSLQTDVRLTRPTEAICSAASCKNAFSLVSVSSGSWLEERANNPNFDNRILGFAKAAFRINSPYLVAAKPMQGAQTFFDAYEIADKYLNPLRHTKDFGPKSRTHALNEIKQYHLICLPSASRAPIPLGTYKGLIRYGLDDYAVYSLLSVAGANLKEDELRGRIIYQAMVKMGKSPCNNEDVPMNFLTEFSDREIRLVSYSCMITSSAVENSVLLPYFLGNGIKPYEWDSEEWDYSLDIAIKNGCKRNIELLMKYGAKAESSRDYIENDLIINDKNRPTVIWFKNLLNKG